MTKLQEELFKRTLEATYAYENEYRKWCKDCQDTYLARQVDLARKPMLALWGVIEAAEAESEYHEYLKTAPTFTEWLRSIAANPAAVKEAEVN